MASHNFCYRVDESHGAYKLAASPRLRRSAGPKWEDHERGARERKSPKSIDSLSVGHGHFGDLGAYSPFCYGSEPSKAADSRERRSRRLLPPSVGCREMSTEMNRPRKATIAARTLEGSSRRSHRSSHFCCPAPTRTRGRQGSGDFSQKPKFGRRSGLSRLQQ